MQTKPTVVGFMPQIIRTTTLGGGNLIESVQLRQSSSVELTVANGLVQGNRKDPNPLFYRKLTRQLIQGGKVEWFGPSSGVYIMGAESIWTGFLPAGPVTIDALTLDYSGLFDRAFGKIVHGTSSRPGLRGQAENVVDAAEAGQVKGMVGKYVKAAVGVARGIRNIAKGKPPNFPKWDFERREKWWADKWLEYRYGWMPLLSSAHEAMDNFFRSHYAQERREKARVTRYTLSRQRDFTQAWNSTGAPKPSKVEVWDFKSERIEICLVFRSDVSWLANFTSLDPVSIGWELVPFSFVVDWFVNVGGYLRSWDNWRQFQRGFHHGYFTTSGKSISALYTRDSFGGPRQRLPTEFASFLAGMVANGEAVTTLIECERKLITSLPTPVLPRFEPRLGPTQIADGIALVRQAVGTAVGRK